jgi:hypothetical protein
VTAEAEDCAVCGRPRSGVEPKERWLDVDIYRVDDDDLLDERSEGFCSQEHAAEWLLRPLPPVARGRPAHRWGWRDRLATAGVASVFGLVAATCLLGIVTAVRWFVALLT